MGVPDLLLTNLALVGAMMSGLWLVSLLRRDVSIVDVFWGLGFILICWTSFLTQQTGTIRAIVLAVTVSLWGGRLAGYIAWRNHGQEEDYRYRAMRNRYGRAFPLLSLPLVFGLQGTIMWLVSLPLQLGQASPSPWHWLDAVGLAVWLVGWLFESVGDWQLARFKRRPENAGKVMDGGLWRYTRHPNYFGDFLVWWGFYLTALASGHGLWTLLSPLLMSFLLIRVSGVALLEKSIQNRRPEYADYVRRTSAFVPWPPRRQ